MKGRDKTGGPRGNPPTSGIILTSQPRRPHCPNFFFSYWIKTYIPCCFSINNMPQNIESSGDHIISGTIALSLLLLPTTAGRRPLPAPQTGRSVNTQAKSAGNFSVLHECASQADQSSQEYIRKGQFRMYPRPAVSSGIPLLQSHQDSETDRKPLMRSQDEHEDIDGSGSASTLYTRRLAFKVKARQPRRHKTRRRLETRVFFDLSVAGSRNYRRLSLFLISHPAVGFIKPRAMALTQFAHRAETKAVPEFTWSTYTCAYLSPGGDVSRRWMQHDGNTARQFSALHVGVMWHQARVSVAPLLLVCSSEMKGSGFFSEAEVKQLPMEHCTRLYNAKNCLWSTAPDYTTRRPRTYASQSYPNTTSLVCRRMLYVMTQYSRGRWRKREIPEKTCRPAASSGTIPTCESLGTTSSEVQYGSSRNRMRLERASENKSSVTRRTPYDRVKRRRELSVDIVVCGWLHAGRQSSHERNDCASSIVSMKAASKAESCCMQPEMQRNSSTRCFSDKRTRERTLHFPSYRVEERLYGIDIKPGVKNVPHKATNATMGTVLASIMAATMDFAQTLTKSGSLRTRLAIDIMTQLFSPSMLPARTVNDVNTSQPITQVKRNLIVRWPRVALGTRFRSYWPSRVEGNPLLVGLPPGKHGRVKGTLLCAVLELSIRANPVVAASCNTLVYGGLTAEVCKAFGMLAKDASYRYRGKTISLSKSAPLVVDVVMSSHCSKGLSFVIDDWRLLAGGAVLSPATRAVLLLYDACHNSAVARHISYHHSCIGLALKCIPFSNPLGATVAERLACSHPTSAMRVQSPARALRILASGNRAERCRRLAGLLRDLPFPPAPSFRR
ncbi:hypothetical protein PR048_004031 [Dryococelus australis]|uniref:Uncharacterized protein n=1 Tax=Dryococelus australis TaxID=614101 RepID=A0ABQ9I6B4_9NEOP|nr:hypothetical protein PR048_004031 [Dryococelus australis]